MFEKTLTDIVKGIRASKRDTALYISQCIAEIKTEISDSDMYVKANALQKLTFLQMMGYSMSWASFATIEVMSSPRFAHKRIGYLAASQGFTQDTDVILLTTNLLKKEMRGAIGGNMNGVYEAGLAVNCVSNIVTEELAQDLLPELTHLTQHPQPYLRKKAILCLFKVFVKYPQGLRLTFSQIQNCLNDQNSAVVSCAVNVITELSDKNPKNYLHLAPAFFDLLTSSSNNWMLIKVVKLLGSLVPEEPRLARKLLEPLADIVRNTPAKSLLYEAVHAITLCLPYCKKSDGSMPASVPEIVALCARTLKEFVEEKDQNLKYLGLVGFGSLMQSHPKVLSAPNYRPLILACLSDEDVTIRTRALGLLPGMASRKNVVELVTQLLQHVELASGNYKLELVRVIVEMCSGEKYALLPDFAWYLDTLFKLGHMRGLDTHAELLRQQVADVALRVLPVRAYAVKRSVEILLEGEQINISQDIDSDNGRGKHIIPEILPALAWIVGEYSTLIPEVLNMDPNTVHIYNTDSEGPYHSIVQVLSAPSCQAKLPTATQKVYIQGAMKVFAAACSNHQVSNVELESCTRTLCTHLPVYMQSIDSEVQQRAFSAYALLESLGLASTGVFDRTPGLASIEDDSDSDERKCAEGTLLETSGILEVTSLGKTQNVPSFPDARGTLASRCLAASETLNFLLKPSPMKPNGAKAQRKKYQTPIGVDDQVNATVNIAVFSTLLEQERAQRTSSRLTMESVSFTQQRPQHTSETLGRRMGPVVGAISSEDLPPAGASLNGMKGDPTNFPIGGLQRVPAPANPTLDRPHTASDPFYLNAAPSVVDYEESANMTSRFGMIQLGEGESEDDDAAGDKGKRKKKKKEKKKKTAGHAVDLGAIFGGNDSRATNTGQAQPITVYTSDDDDDDMPVTVRNSSRNRPGKEFQGLANVDLTMPLREDEVMPERRHRVVPAPASQGFKDAPDSLPEPKASKSKKKQKKKEPKKSSRGESQVQGVGDLLDLAFTPMSQAAAPQHVELSSIFDTRPAQPHAQLPTSQNQSDTISSACDDLLGFSDNIRIPRLPGAAPSITAGPAVDTMRGLGTSATTQPTGAHLSSRSTKHPWIRGSIKSSQASGPPVVDWSKVQLFSHVLKTKGHGLVTAWITVRIENDLETSGVNITSLDLEGFGNVPIGIVTPGTSAERSQVGPFSYSSTDAPLELKGVLSASGCRVPIKLYLPVSVYIAPTNGLTLEDVAHQLASPIWSSLSTKLRISSEQNVKTALANFLRLAEVQPDLSGPADGTFAGQSVASGAQIRLLAKVKKDKVKIDLKTTNPQIGEAIISDLKHLVL
jgi:AP-3 complex subunit delta-1